MAIFTLEYKQDTRYAMGVTDQITGGSVVLIE